MTRIQIVSGKLFKQGDENPFYVELNTMVDSDQIAVVSVFDVESKHEYIALVSDVSERPHCELDFNTKVSEFATIVRFSREDLATIKSNLPTIVQFRFLDGYIEKHTIITPLSSKTSKIKVCGIECDSSNIRISPVESPDESSHDSMVSEKPNTSNYVPLNYFDVIRKVEKRNGAFPCISH